MKHETHTDTSTRIIRRTPTVLPSENDPIHNKTKLADDNTTSPPGALYPVQPRFTPSGFPTARHIYSRPSSHSKRVKAPFRSTLLRLLPGVPVLRCAASRVSFFSIRSASNHYPKPAWLACTRLALAALFPRNGSCFRASTLNLAPSSFLHEIISTTG